MNDKKNYKINLTKSTYFLLKLFKTKVEALVGKRISFDTLLEKLVDSTTENEIAILIEGSDKHE